jgi:hypothetical protein
MEIGKASIQQTHKLAFWVSTCHKHPSRHATLPTQLPLTLSVQPGSVCMTISSDCQGWANRVPENYFKIIRQVTPKNLLSLLVLGSMLWSTSATSDEHKYAQILGDKCNLTLQLTSVAGNLPEGVVHTWTWPSRPKHIAMNIVSSEKIYFLFERLF